MGMYPVVIPTSRALTVLPQDMFLYRGREVTGGDSQRWKMLRAKVIHKLCFSKVFEGNNYEPPWSFSTQKLLDPVVMVRYLGVRSGGFCCEDFVF